MKLRITTALAVLALVAAATPLFGHQGAVPLTFWSNDFGAQETQCQITIGTGAARCGLRAWDIRRRCQLRILEGETCDEEADDDAIEQIRRDVFTGDINPVCSQAELSVLLFSDPQDIQFDVVTFCREFEAAAVSVAFGPYLRVDDPSQLPEEDKECIRGFAAATSKAFNFALRSRKGTLDRIANRRRNLAAKNLEVDNSDRRVAGAETALIQSVLNRCSAERFEQLYLFPPEDLVRLVVSRAACFADRTYPVIAFECPEPVCGNAMRETNERCDDGNDFAGDDCTNSCQFAFCGDGIHKTQGNTTEECDDGNREAGDGCSPGCELEP